ncbi:MAG: hypothetical protein QM599_08635 [Pseudoxanthomonas sp.]
MRYLLILSLTAMLAACSQNDAPAPVPVPEQAAVPDVAVKLPGGIKFDVPSELRTDKSYQTKKGATHRRATYELLEATPDQARDVVTAKLAEAGYVAGEPKPSKKKEGQYSIKYKKKKAASVTVYFYPKLAKKPANPAAKSMIAFDWQTKKAPKPTDAPAQ